MKNKKLTIILIILIVILVLAVGLCVGMWVSGGKVQIVNTEKESTTDKIKEEEKIVEDNKKTENQTIVNSENNQKSDNDKTELENTISANEMFKLYSKGLQESYSNLKDSEVLHESVNSPIIFGEITGFDDESLKNIGILEIYIDYNNDLWVDLMEDSAAYKKYGPKYKLISNALDCGVYQVGQDMGFAIWAIDTEGNFYINNGYIDSTTSQEEIDFSLIKKEKMRNIVSVSRFLTGETITLVCTDINGQFYVYK